MIVVVERGVVRETVMLGDWIRVEIKNIPERRISGTANELLTRENLPCLMDFKLVRIKRMMVVTTKSTILLYSWASEVKGK